jgi:2-iminobutanoate/2-iminopropanoate deaminase
MEDNMPKRHAIAGSLAIALFVIATAASAQALEKKHFNYSEWTKGRFSEAVTVTGPGKMIFLAGVGAEDENGKGGDILHKGDFMGQCHYAYDKIKRLLQKQGATLADVVKMVTYMTDVRYQPDYGKCRVEEFGSNPLPAHTLLNISQLAWPGMLVEIDVTAVVPVK